MKKIISAVLVCALIISFLPSCAFADQSETIPNFRGLNDPELLRYLEDSVYAELIGDLNSEDYFVENVSAVYISKEYLEEMAYNSKTNIFFGYSLEELDAQFQGTRYVFTLGEDGETVVEPFSPYDDTYDRVIRNVAIGTGVILVCVTVSVVTAGAGAPAISLIFAASAKTGAAMALSGAALGGASSAIITGLQTHDPEKTLKAAALGGSEGFKWGAVSGAIGGGAHETIKYSSAMKSLKGIPLDGLSTQEAAKIQMESGYPVDVIKQFKSMKQYNICKGAGLKPEFVNGHTALVREIDLNYVDEFGRTNLERMKSGLAAIDPATGESFQLHHIGQKPDSTLAILSKAEHMQEGNNAIWHEIGKPTTVHGPNNPWDAQRQAFWKAMAKALQ